jgi:hypothetical protein
MKNGKAHEDKSKDGMGNLNGMSFLLDIQQDTCD